MRVEILATDAATFVRPMADGLARMVNDCGGEARVHYNGIERLMLRQQLDFSSARSFAGSALRLGEARASFEEFVSDMTDADLIVVVACVPGAFSPALLPNIEILRARLPKVPIVNYDLHYLPTLDSWARFLLRGERTGLSPDAVRIFSKGKFGLERYDWYLMASVGTEVPLPEGSHPFSIIGLDLDDGSLYPEQGGQFRALVDFAQNRGDFPAFREIQLQALQRAGVEYEVLEGRYPIDEIRRIYRRSSIYFLSSSEAFGLPICELQACGSLVFTPDPYWPAAHWLGDDYYSARTPLLSENFVVYENTVEKLTDSIKAAAAAANPDRVRQRFEEVQPHFLRGDRKVLSEFLERVSSGRIHSTLHREHSAIGKVAVGV